MTLGKCLPLSEPSIELSVLTLAISGLTQKQDKNCPGSWVRCSFSDMVVVLCL